MAHILQAKLCRGEAVIVSVYAERPGKRRVSSSSSNSHRHRRHHHHHHVHHVIKQEVNLNKNGDSGKGYSRRAELLHYSQRLRESALSATSAPLVPKPVSSNHHHQPTTNIVAAPSKPRFSRSTSPALSRQLEDIDSEYLQIFDKYPS
ncbi:hypothetical protein OIU85_026427 [Salix viminalis]|uniref:Uncharacterized protein n=1 Tax=Salix viminalis TaxID=40686 RepID=A0A9Q0TNP3_SALVM|nr:hypothetical protein OIU85_026427 [Salix viminalis]